MKETLPASKISTIPDTERPPEREILVQTPVRLHRHDMQMLKGVLKRDKLSLQKFIGYCVQGYLDADERILTTIKFYREMDLIPKNVREKHSLSQRERLRLFDEIENGGKDVGDQQED